MTGQARPTRRAVIAGGLALLVEACRPRRNRPRVAASTEPDQAIVDTAVAEERALIAMYDAITPAGAPAEDYRVAARSLHVQHLQALGAKLPASPTPTSSPTPGPRSSSTSEDAPRAESSSAARLRASAIAAESGTTAALLASIAASHSILSSTRQVGTG